MSDKPSRSPHASTQGTRLQIVARGSRRTSPEAFPLILPSWGMGGFAEPAFESGVEPPSFRNRLLGLAVIVGVSGGFWTGVALFINHLMR